MLSTWPRTRSPLIITLVLSLCLIHGGIAADVCEDPTWPDDLVIARRADTSLTTSSRSVTTSGSSVIVTSSSSSTSRSVTTSKTSVTATSSSSSISSSSPISSPLPDLLGGITSGNITAGEVNCRWTDYTDADVNYYTCTQLAQRNNIDVAKFFLLNPKIRTDCGNIQPNSVYCVRGFIEPVRTTAGLCGPPNNNASCAGYDGGQCCNSATWTCGNSTADCADGTCYEGSCPGDSVFSTDGTCGSNFRNKRCGGKWGECCNLQGRCGSGDAFCAWGNCNSGNCSIPDTGTGTEPIPPFMRGNTTDGTCGPASKFSCTVIYGFCCNKDGICGSSVADCGVGCQKDWGDCNNVTSTTSRTSSKSSSTSSKSSTVLLTSSTSVTSKSVSTTTTSKSSSGLLTSSTSSKPVSTSATKTSTTTTTTLPAISSLPSCGQTCFNNVIASYSSLGCSSPDPSCMCGNVNFGFGIRDCSNGACGTAVASTVIAYQSQYCARALATGTSRPVTTTTTKATTATSLPAVSSLPTCGQTCFNNMLAQYSALGCASPIPSCLCSNVNFQNGLRDCANGACGTTVGATVIAYGNAYCVAASPTATITSIKPTPTTALSSLPTCGQTCFNNMLAQYSALGCASANAACLCKNANFQFGLRDCSNGACGTVVASTIIAYGSAYCAAATATPKP